MPKVITEAEKERRRKIGQKLEYIRKVTGKSKGEMAQVVGMLPAHYTKMCRGEAVPTKLAEDLVGTDDQVEWTTRVLEGLKKRMVPILVQLKNDKLVNLAPEILASFNAARDAINSFEEVCASIESQLEA